MNGIRVFTVGHSNHPLDRFVVLLKQHEIQSLVDIRRFPASRRLPHFNQPRLAEALRENAVHYHWLESLGGHREQGIADSPNAGIREAAFRNYADHMLGDEFRSGISQLLQIARKDRTAIMCAESAYRDCHRRLVSDYLLANGVSVQHVLPTGDVTPHAMTPGAKTCDGNVTYPPAPSLFD